MIDIIYESKMANIMALGICLIYQDFIIRSQGILYNRTVFHSKK